MKSQQTMTILGGGRFARAISRILGAKKVDARLYARRAEAREQLGKDLEGITIESDIERALDGSQVVFFAVPAHAMLEVAGLYGRFATGDQTVLLATRGVGDDFQLPHEMIRAKTCVRKIGVLGGPLHVRELKTGRPINAVVASKFSETVNAVKQLTEGTPVFVHASKDIIGVQIAGAISNVAAIAAGMSEVLDMGDTARGVLLTHGLCDAKRLGIALGADDRTFSGLAGIGDLIPRQVTSTERHAQIGAKVAKGASLEDAMKEAVGHVEGVHTARAGALIAEKRCIDLPLVAAVHRILAEGTDARTELEGVLRRDLDLGSKKL